MADLSWGAKYALERIEKATDDLRAEIVRLETAMDDQTGVVQKLKPYPLEKVVRQTHHASFGTPEA